MRPITEQEATANETLLEVLLPELVRLNPSTVQEHARRARATAAQLRTKPPLFELWSRIADKLETATAPDNRSNLSARERGSTARALISLGRVSG